MKILFVIDTLYSTNNGTSISALRYADELRRHVSYTSSAHFNKIH